MNDKFFSSLSPDVQKIITDTAKILVNCAVTTSIIMLIIGTVNVTLWFLATQQENKPVLTNFMADRIVRETNGPLNEAGLVNLATEERYAFVWSTRTKKKRLLARIRLASTH